MNLIINIVGVILIILIYWFFFMKKESKAVEVDKEIKIVVAGGYKPDVIKVKLGESTILKFYREDESSCLEEVVIPDLNVREHLVLNETTAIEIKPEKTGVYEFSCGMNMFHGKIVVEE